MSLRLSVLVPVYNSAPSLSLCLAAILASDYPNLECLVVDDSSTDRSAELAARYPVRLLSLTGGPKGPAFARNHAAGFATGDILVFIDADVVVHPTTLSQLAASFADAPRVAAVFGSYDASPAARDFVSQYRNLFHHFVHQQGRESASTFWAGCGAVRRDVFLQVGGFDASRYPRPSIEDIELGYRLRNAGYTIVLNKAAQAQHLKVWTLRGMIKTDVLNRAIPWTRLNLEARAMPDDLNLRLSQRVSALLPCLALVYLAALPLTRPPWQWLLLPLLLALALVVGLNLQFYRFFARQRGILFAVEVIPFHLLYYLYSVVAFAVGAGLHLAARRSQG